MTDGVDTSDWNCPCDVEDLVERIVSEDWECDVCNNERQSGTTFYGVEGEDWDVCEYCYHGKTAITAYGDDDVDASEMAERMSLLNAREAQRLMEKETPLASEKYARQMKDKLAQADGPVTCRDCFEPLDLLEPEKWKYMMDQESRKVFYRHLATQVDQWGSPACVDVCGQCGLSQSENRKLKEQQQGQEQRMYNMVQTKHAMVPELSPYDRYASFKDKKKGETNYTGNANYLTYMMKHTDHERTTWGQLRAKIHANTYDVAPIVMQSDDAARYYAAEDARPGMNTDIAQLRSNRTVCRSDATGMQINAGITDLVTMSRKRGAY